MSGYEVLAPGMSARECSASAGKCFFERCQRGGREGRGVRACVCVSACAKGGGFMSRTRVIFVYSGVGEILMRCDTAYGECVRACGEMRPDVR